MKKNISCFLTVLLVLFAALSVGCSEEVGDRLVSVSFDAEADNSRSIFSTFGSVVAPEDCFWTYTAVKTAGQYTTGASEKNSSGKLIEKRVSDGRGLSGVSRKFSQGNWTFSIFGYADKDCTQLIYTAEKSDVSFTSASQTVIFTLKNSTESGLSFTTTDLASGADKTFNDKGVLEVGDLFIFPQAIRNDYIPAGSILLVELLEGTTKIASSTTTAYFGIDTTDPRGGNEIHINPLVIVNGKEQFSAGTHTLTLKVTCTNTPKPDQSTVEPLVIGSCKFAVPFIAGSKTTVYGYLSDITCEMITHPVGGSIFYIGPDNGAKYRFFDCLGREITTFTVEALRSAYTYTVEGLADSAQDRFYVCNKAFIKSHLRWGSVSTAGYTADLSYIGTDGKLYKMDYVNGFFVYNGRLNYNHWWSCDEDIFLSSLGKGKSNTAYVMNFKKGGSNVTMDSTYHVEDNTTVWYWLKNTINKSGSTVNTTGLYDWYIPSITELIYLERSVYGSILPKTIASGDSDLLHCSTLTSAPFATGGDKDGCCTLGVNDDTNALGFNVYWRSRYAHFCAIRSF